MERSVNETDIQNRNERRKGKIVINDEIYYWFVRVKKLEAIELTMRVN